MDPFCYLGKKHLEEALSKIDTDEEIILEWRSYLLNPSLDETPQDTISYLSDVKRVSRTKIEEALRQIVNAGKGKGITFNFDTSQVVSTYKAHLVIQKAKERGLGTEASEAFFKAYFTDGKNLADEKDLIEIGESIGLSEKDVKNALNQEKYKKQFEQDIEAANKKGVKTIPFFVIEGNVGVSGAQPVNVFRHFIAKALKEKKA